MTATFYTIVALVAFATNSLLCRMALMEGAIDPWNFTILRLLSGAICLGIIITLHTHRLKHQTQTVTSFNSDSNTDNNNAAVAASAKYQFCDFVLQPFLATLQFLAAWFQP